VCAVRVRLCVCLCLCAHVVFVVCVFKSECARAYSLPKM